MPRTSGLLQGAGIKRWRRRKSAIKGWGKNFPDQMLSNGRIIREEVPDFDPALEFGYTQRELMLLAEKILLVDAEERRPCTEDPMILSAAMVKYRMKPEIYTADGTPDPAINEGLYWRTHPAGRRWSTEEMRRTTGCSFYDGVQETEMEIVPPAPPPPPARMRTDPCTFEGCDNKAVVVSLGLCSGHYQQHLAGREMKPLQGRRKFTDAQLDEIRETWDSGESNAEVARRYHASPGYIARVRREGLIRGLGEISRTGA